MTMVFALFELSLSLLSGSLFIALAFAPMWHFSGADNNDSARRARKCLQSCLALGAALGWCSCFSFLNFAGVPAIATLLLQIALSVSLVFLYKRQRARNRSIEYSIGAAASNTDIENVVASKPRWLLLGFALLYILAALFFLILTVQQPHGGGDSWAIWNMHARFFFRGGANWTAFLAPPISWTHADYPLLMPLSVARGWSLVGRETTIVPAVLAFFFTMGTGALLAAAIWILRGSVQAFVASLLLLSVPSFLVNGAGQCADVPLSFFFLATAVCFALHDSFAQQNDEAAAFASKGVDKKNAKADGMILVAGTMAGAAAWTKNEGLLFVVAVVVARLLFAKRATKTRHFASELLAFAGGAMPFLLVIALFKHNFAPPSDLASGQGETFFSKIGDASRYATIFAAFIQTLWNFNAWFFPPLVVMLPYAYLLGLRRGIWRRAVALEYSTTAVLIALMLLGYFFIYLSTPRDLAWHLETSLARLLLQLWPMLVFVFFLLVRTPQEALAESVYSRKGNCRFLKSAFCANRVLESA